MKLSPSLKIIDQSFVSPTPLPAGEIRQSLPLTLFDMFWFNYNPVERLFFFDFPHSTSHFMEIRLPIIKSALSAALSTFYPLAGTINRRSQDGRFQIATTDSDSITLIVSEYIGSAADFLDISSDHPRPIQKLLHLAPRLPKSRDEQPLLAVQVTLFPNYGICIAIAVLHAGCDGFSSTQFVKLWAATSAAAFQQIDLIPRPPAPVMDRTIICDSRNLYEHMEKEVLSEHAKENMVASGIVNEVFAYTFVFSAPEIARLKNHVQRKMIELGMPGFHCSSFVVCSAYSWICLLKTRCITDEDGVAHFIFAADWRKRIRPPIPENYFGNCISGCFAKGKAEELLGRDGLLVASSAIGKGIEELGNDVHEVMDGLVEKLAKLAPWRPLSMAGSPKIGVYETDFGWGKPRKVEVISTRETGAMAVAENRNGDGGIEFGIILPEEELKAFAHHFAVGRDW